MEITIFKEPYRGQLQVKVSLFEEIDGRGTEVDVSVWVKYQDSISAMQTEAKQKAIEQLKRSITALEGGEV
jgi:hypothetical protein